MDDDKNRHMWHGRQASLLAGYLLLWTTHHHPPVLFRSENRGSNFLGQKIRIKEPSVPVTFQRLQRTGGFLERTSRVINVVLWFFFVPFLRAMVIYANMCNHSSQQGKNLVTKFITAGSLLDPIDSNPHCCYVWMEPKETRKKRGGAQPPSTSQKLGWIKIK